MYRDVFGNPVTTDNPATVAAIGIYTADWIGYGLRLRSIFDAASADPECAFANACAASVHMALEARSGFEAARPYLVRMRRTVHRASEPERLFIAATEAWAAGAIHTALCHISTLVQRFPTDIAAAKWGQYHAFNLGDARTMRHLAEGVFPAHASTPEAWGMLAFAREQCHDLDGAEFAANRALAMKGDEPWAHHTVAHVLDARGRVREGIRFLGRHAPSWDTKSIFVREHNWWHLAVFHLEQGDGARALEIFDRHLWGTWREFAQEQIGAVQALWRLELAGIDVGARWNPISDEVAARGCEHVLPFHDMHFAYALARAGKQRAARNFVASLARRAESEPTGVWKEIALPATSAVVSHALGDYATAERELAPILLQTHRLGGSNAQRDVLFQTYIDSALRSGNASTASALINVRARAKPSLPATRRLLLRARRLHAVPPTRLLAA
jgi:hypothetical protein